MLLRVEIPSDVKTMDPRAKHAHKKPGKGALYVPIIEAWHKFYDESQVNSAQASDQASDQQDPIESDDEPSHKDFITFKGCF